MDTLPFWRFHVGLLDHELLQIFPQNDSRDCRFCGPCTPNLHWAIMDTKVGPPERFPHPDDDTITQSLMDPPGITPGCGFIFAEQMQGPWPSSCCNEKRDAAVGSRVDDCASCLSARAAANEGLSSWRVCRHAPKNLLVRTLLVFSSRLVRTVRRFGS